MIPTGEADTGTGADPDVTAFLEQSAAPLTGHQFGTTGTITGSVRAKCPCGELGPHRRTVTAAERDSRQHVHMSTVGGLYTADTAATVARLTPKGNTP